MACQVLDISIGNIENELRNKYKPKKRTSLLLMNWALELELINGNSAYGYFSDGIIDCGSHLKFASTKDTKHKCLCSARFCRWRFCLMCAWRLAMKRGFILSVIMKRLINLKERFIFVTLTIPNVESKDLSDSITVLSNGWQRLLQRKKYADFIIGGIRKVEVTYNRKAKTYHPHLHILCCVKPEYFDVRQIGTRGKRRRVYPNMIPFEIWQSDWQRAVRNPNAQQIFVKAVSDNPDKLEKLVGEISKYAAKESDMAVNKEAFNGFVLGMKGKRLFTPFGVMSDLWNEFIEDKTKFYDCFDPREPQEWFWKCVAEWDDKKRDYVQSYSLLTDEEKVEAQKKWLGDFSKMDLEEQE